MHPRLQHILSEHYALLMQLMLATVLSAIFVVFVLVEYFSDEASALTDSCQPTTFSAGAVAMIAPTRFWSRQVQSLERIVGHSSFVPPSSYIREQTAKLLPMLEKIRRENPVELTSAQSKAEELRAAADRIENEEALRRLDADAFEKWQRDYASVSRCLVYSRSRLAIRR